MRLHPHVHLPCIPINWAANCCILGCLCCAAAAAGLGMGARPGPTCAAKCMMVSMSSDSSTNRTRSAHWMSPLTNCTGCRAVKTRAAA
jgi:hypothetical protein